MKNIERGISERHARSCPYPTSAKRCTCTPTYRVQVRRLDRHVYRTFPTLRAARAFRDDAERHIVEQRHMPSNDTIGEALIRLHADLLNGTAMTRSGEDFKPGVAACYRQSIERYLLPALGGQFARVRTRDLAQRHIAAVRDELKIRRCARSNRPLSPATIRNALIPLRVLVRRETERGVLERDPFLGVIMPAVRPEERTAISARSATMLLSVLDPDERAFFAIAVYAGLRSGEISGLHWGDVDFWNDNLHVVRAYDQRSDTVTLPKTRKSQRIVPIVPNLRAILEEYQAHLATTLGAERIASGTQIFVSANGRRMRGSGVTLRANARWRERGMQPVGLHACRHTFASMAIAAGVSLFDLSQMLGHSSINLTADVYGHLYPDSRDAVRERLSSYLADQS